jgi:hypothetical protein
MPKVSQAHLDARRRQIVDAARARFAGHGFARHFLGLLLFPTVDAGPELLARADAFLAEHKDGDAGMLRAVVEGRDTAERAIASRALA